MSKKGRKRTKRIAIILGAIIIAFMGINWFMTYRVEDTLRKRLRSEIIKATDGFYDFSFKSLNVGLFSGELMIEGLAFWPDSAHLSAYRDNATLPKFYFDVNIDTIEFKGINLKWRIEYRKLSFDQFLVKSPSIKIISPQKEYVSTAESDSLKKNKTIHESISPFFDKIQAGSIDFKRAKVEYMVMDSTYSTYSLKDFNFQAHNFLLDEHSQDMEHLLFSDDFEFHTETDQVIYESDHLIFNVGKMKLSTKDSIIHIANAHLKPKDKHWEKRFTAGGSAVDAKVGGVVLNGISFSRKGSYNLLDARNFSIRYPTIEYFNVKREGKDITHSTDTVKNTAWTLYSIVSPIFERVKIENINVESAQLEYSETQNEITDKFTLRKLDFFANSFQVDSLSHKYNFFLYVKDFLIDAKNITGHVPSKNSSVNVDYLSLNTMDKKIKISDAKVAPINTSLNDSYMTGAIDKVEVSGLKYTDGIDADLIEITSPKVDLVVGKEIKKKKTTENKKDADNILDAIAPFISYISVKDIIITDGNAKLKNRKDDNEYRLSNLDFYARNFRLDKETRRIRDYLFKWDEYSFSFQDFDNLTPDKKYRIQIKEGDFSSITGDMFLTDLKVTPDKNNTASYVSITTPHATLLGLDEKGVRQRKISFKTFILDSPVIEIVKEDDQAAKEAEKDVMSIALKLINFDLLTIPSPSIYFHDAPKGRSAQIQTIQMHIDSFRWELNERFSIHNFIVEEPYISIVESKENVSSGKKGEINIASLGNIDIKKLNIRMPILKIKKPNLTLDFSADNYTLISLYWDHKTNSTLEIHELDFNNPELTIREQNKEKQRASTKMLTREEIIKKISAYANKTKLGKINISNFNLNHTTSKTDGSKTENKLVNTHLLIENLDTDLNNKRLTVDEFAFKTKDIDYPLMDGFYTLRIGDINFSKRKESLDIRKIKLNPNYPKFDFAYIHPTGADWFNVEIDSIHLSGIDVTKFILDTILLVKKMEVNHVLLENFKNQKIDIEHNIMPLLYEEFQKFPIKYNIDDLDIKDFTVIYEELAKKGFEPARIPFSNMNGHIKGFTNIQKGDSTFYTLYADGLAMGTAPFVAKWKIPVDSTNDKFFLTAEIEDLDMRDFNQLVRPMAPAYVKSGRLNKLSFQTEATSIGATVDMEFMYDSLYLVMLRSMDDNEKHKQFTRLVNRWVLEESNYGKNIRNPHNTIVRNPYHSNFNYFWQILQPPLIESVGVSKEKQNIAHNLVTIFNRVKRFFGGAGKKEEKKKN